MGLSAPKKRRRIAHDPNNVSWSRNSTSYGHRILSSQGWAPGSTLGAASAAHAPHYTAGSSSHIRVLLKDDTLGLGAKRGKQNEENFGLGQLADIYGRLNGKSDTVLEGEKRARADLGANLYVQQRFGALAFVRGGFLVGNRIEEEEPVMVEQELEPAEQVIGRDDGEMGKKIQKKRKRVETDTIDDAETTAPTSAVAQGETAVEEKTAQKDGETKEERRHRKEERRKAKAAHKAEKALRRAAKGERRKRKEEKRLRRARDASTAGDGVTTDTSSAPASIQPPASPAPPPEQATPGVPTPPINNPFNNRNTVRQRFIRQKRMASMDPQALREILMLKA